MAFDIFDVAPSQRRPLRAILPIEGTDRFDPFLVLHEQGPVIYEPGAAIGFEDHSHRGIETVTYVVEGEQYHRDSRGHAGTIAAGGVQWMTAAAGIEHAELPTESMLRRGGPMHAFQIWLDLPHDEKRLEPRYQEFDVSQLPVVHSRGTWIRLLAGTHADTSSPIAVRRGTTIAHVRAQPRADHAFALAPGATTLIFAMRGSALLSGQLILQNQLAATRGVRSHVSIGAGSSGFEGLVLTALPVRSSAPTDRREASMQ